MASKARRVAARVLERLAQDEAFAAAVLDAEIVRSDLDRRDAALATEIVYGTLRALPKLDAIYLEHVRHAGAAIEPYAQAVLRTATYQILHVAITPTPAVVHESVELVRASRGEGLAKLVNALLRKVAPLRPVEPRSPDRVELPAWLSERLVRDLGAERTRAFAENRTLPPPTGLRASLRTPRDELLRRLVRARPAAEVRAGALSDRAVLVRRAGDPRRLEGFREGHFAIQEEGAQVVGLLAGAEAGACVIDVCAGRGGKTGLFAEQVGQNGRVIALDLHPTKLARLVQEMERLGVAERVQSCAVDLRVGTGGLGAVGDLVVVDAPCTGLGTLHRRPEILLRVGEPDPARLGAVQLDVLRRASELVRPGGALVFATCSPLDDEGRGVAMAFETSTQAFSRDTAWPALSGVEHEPDGSIRIGPWNAGGMAGVDAYQAFRWRRN